MRPYLCGMNTASFLIRLRRILIPAMIVSVAAGSSTLAQVDLQLTPPPGKAGPEGALPAPAIPPHGQAAKPAPVETGPEQRAKLLEELYTRLSTAPDQATSDQISTAIEQLWGHSGSATADLLVARAVAVADLSNK